MDGSCHPGYRGRKRSRDPLDEKKTTRSEHELVKRHYNGSCEAKGSKAPHKSWNNWVKAVLIASHVRPGSSVLDLAGGHGGDLGKYRHLSIERLVHVDFAARSVQEAKRRYEASRLDRSYKAVFLVGDMQGPDLLAGEPLLFDVVSCQFALHYAWRSHHTASAVLHNVSRALKPGGSFIGTIPDADVLLQQRFRLHSQDSLVRMELCVEDFGTKYHFSLEGAIDNCPEYLVRLSVLRELAAQHGLRLVRAENFVTFYERQRQTKMGQELMAAMKVPSFDRLSRAERGVFELYTTFEFQKET